MTDHGIIFSAPMIRALMAGHKTQTRRLATSPLRRVKVGDRLWVRETCRSLHVNWLGSFFAHAIEYRATMDQAKNARQVTTRDGINAYWKLACYNQKRAKDTMWADDDGTLFIAGPWVPSIHMPRHASRLTLIVTDVRTQPINQISGADAVAEGVRSRLPDAGVAQAEFHDLWDSLHGKPGERWADSPDVVALTFHVEQRNIDQTKEA